MSITPLPSAPAVNDSTAEFNTKAFAWVAALDTFTTETNALATQVDADATTASNAATNASESENAAVAAANYKGPWSSLTGALTVPASVSHNGAVYGLTENLANVAANEPGVTSPSKWLLLTIPAQAGQSGKFLTTDGSTMSWASLPAPSSIKTPTNVSPAASATGIGPTPALTGSTFYELYGLPKSAGQWQVSTVSNFATTVINTGDVAGTDLFYTVSSGVLSVNTTYYWRVRYKNSLGEYSEWSTPTTFTTAAAFGPTTYGQSWAGGYYGGQITVGSTSYYLIVSPKASGEFSSGVWSAGSATGTSSTDGYTNTYSNNTTATQRVQYQTINGYSDWYFGATDEMASIYTNFQPIAGSEAFNSASYWCSNKFNGSNQYEKHMGNGNLSYSSYTNSRPLRAIRRFPLNWE